MCSRWSKRRRKLEERVRSLKSDFRALSFLHLEKQAKEVHKAFFRHEVADSAAPRTKTRTDTAHQFCGFLLFFHHDLPFFVISECKRSFEGLEGARSVAASSCRATTMQTSIRYRTKLRLRTSR